MRGRGDESSPQVPDLRLSEILKPLFPADCRAAAFCVMPRGHSSSPRELRILPLELRQKEIKGIVMEIVYPSILRRYLSTFIDSIFVLCAFIGISLLLSNEVKTSTYIRVGMVLVLFFVYEPICTSRFCTIGQKITGI